MKTITLKIDETKKSGKVLYELLQVMRSKKDGVEIIEEEEESPNNSEFVNMVLEAAASKERIRIDPANLWESIM